MSGDDLDHPSGDLVVAALAIAAPMEASDLTGSAVPARRRRSGARPACASGSRSAVPSSAPPPRSSSVSSPPPSVLLAVLNRDYLAVYDTPDRPDRAPRRRSAPSRSAAGFSSTWPSCERCPSASPPAQPRSDR
ncbi:MAG: hypothetical protein U5R31_16610 [Acidimicrobiia bacterium]|nr:hypothetical protein [Acidimicrobiia bacterium]